MPLRALKKGFSLEGEKCVEFWETSSIYRDWNAEKNKQKTYGGKS